MNCPACGAENVGLGSTCVDCGADLDRSSSPTAGGDTRGPPGAPLAPGAAFGGRYTIVERIGEGGMGEVYKAIDIDLDRTVALKLVRSGTPAATALERFRRELVLAQQVSHANVCRVHDIGEVEGIHFISMEFIEGQTLSDWTRAVSKLSVGQTIRVARQLCAGLAAIHAASIVHRDLKPSNIMLDTSGRVVIMDFGLAYQPDADRVTAEGEVLGTLAYLSPEQARGGASLDHRSDIYALGLVVFEMLTGARPPADGNSLPMGLRDPAQRCQPPSGVVPGIPAPLDRIVLRCLEHRRAKRYQSVREVDRAFADLQSELDSQPRIPSTPPGRIRRWGGLARLAAVLALGVFLVIWMVPSAPPRTARIGVMPFAYQGDAGTRYMANFLPVALIKRLKAAEEVQAAPFDSSRFFEPGGDPQAVARQLDVDWVVLGDVTVDGSSYRTSIRIWSRDDAQIVWTGDFGGQIARPGATALAAADEILEAAGRGPTTGAAPLPGSEAMTAYVEGLALLDGWDDEENAEAAIAAFARAVAIEADFAEAHAGLARAMWLQYRNTSDPAFVDRAAQAAGRAVELAPDLPEALLAQGIVQLGRGRSAEAAGAFEKAFEMAPGDDAICRRIGDAYLGLGRLEEAEANFARAIQLRPNFWENHNAMGWFHLGNSSFTAAAKSFTEVIDLRPESDVGYTNLAATLILSGDLEEAEPLLEAAIEIQPTGDAYNNLGFVYYSQHRFEEAARQFGLGAEIAPEDPYLWTGLGDASRQLDRPSEARRAYARAVELFRSVLDLDADNPEYETLLATALAGLGRCQEAGEVAAAGTAGEDEAFGAQYYAAVSYAVCGDLDAAETHAVRALEGGYELDVRTNPDLAPLRERPAIAELLR